MTSDRFHPDVVNLDRLFAKGSPKLIVPTNQRRFAWNPRQEVQQLWDDIVGAKQQDLDDYFLGTLVLSRTTAGHLEIIDGQQRLATLTMILAALRNRFMIHGTTNGEASNASHALNNFILRTDFRGRPEDYALTLGSNDSESFKRYVQLRPGDPQHLGLDTSLPQNKPGRRPLNRIQQGFRLLTHEIAGYLDSFTNDQEIQEMTKLAEFILYRLTHMTITVQDDVDAYTLFETVNYRGLNLSTADLLKNHLFGLASTGRNSQARIAELNELWDALIATLDSQEITQFLRYYWISSVRHVSAKELYRQIKDRLRAKRIDPIHFLTKLNDQAYIFDSLVNPKDSDPCAVELRDLRDMRMTQGLPLMLAAKEKCGKAEFERIVNLVETLSIRNTLVGRRNPNSLERSFGDWARRLRTEEDHSSIFAEAAAQCVADAEFAEGLMELTGLTTPQARYILRKIEWAENKETTMASSGVEIEHVLPQRPDLNWKSYMGGSNDDIREACQKLGNLTLLYEKLNKQASARSFNEKKVTYRQSKIQLTQDLCEFPSWTYDSIDARQRTFSERALQIWKI